MSGTTGKTGIIGYTRDALRVVNPHCLQGIACLSEAMDVRACCDIVDDHGARLWASGTRVSAVFAEVLTGRHLQRPLEASLEVGCGATLDSIVGECRDLMNDNPVLARLGATGGAREALHNLRGMPLPGPLKLLLSISRTQRKAAFTGQLAAIIVGAGLAAEIGLGAQDCDRLLLAALLCDIGEMYIDPAYVDGSRPLPPYAWPHLAAHPGIGQAVLDEFTDFPPALTDGVLHHHERLDGSGYPAGLCGPGVSLLGQLCGVVDTLSAIIMRGERAGVSDLRERLAMALRIMPDEFPPPAASWIDRALAPLDNTGKCAASGTFADRVLPTLKQIRSARLLAEALAGASTSQPADIGGRALSVIRHLDKRLRATGVYDLAQLGVLESSPARMGEVCLMLDEVGWRLRHLARRVFQCCGERIGSGDVDETRPIAELFAVLDAPALSLLGAPELAAN